MDESIRDESIRDESIRDESIRDETSTQVHATARRRHAALSRRGVLVGGGSVAAGVALGAGVSRIWQPIVARAAEDGGGIAVVKFHTMTPVTGQFVGAAGTAIRGIHGGGLPWALRSAQGELSADGRLRVQVKGLVLAAGPNSGTNPIPTFRAIVSFETLAPIFTEAVPASTDGDANINMHVELPHPGFAPIIFVGPGTNAVWFAVTGLE
jgi:hypothetical protein